jgi:hypothetical protein
MLAGMRFYALVLLLAQAAGEIALSGRVLDSVTHQPITGARVSYQGSSATSDEHGAWALPLKPGEAYRTLLIHKTGYADFQEEFVLQSGSESHDFELTPGAHLSGRLVDRDSGAGLKGFTVYVHLGPGTEGISYYSKPSGEDGAFAIEASLPPGGYFLQLAPVSGGKWAAAWKDDEPGYGISWYPGVARPEMAAPVTVSAGERRDVEVRLQKRELRHIAGSIEVPKGREGEPISFGLIGAGHTPVLERVLFEGGPWRVAGLSEGSYEVVAAIANESFAFARVQIGGRNVDDLRLTFRPGVSLGAAVSMAGRDEKLPEGISFHPGLFVLAGEQSPDQLHWRSLPPGEYWPMLTLPQGYAVVSETYNGQPVYNEEIVVEAPESTVQFVITSRPGSLSGIVRDRDGKPVANAAVIVLRQPLPERMASTVTSDSNGAFRLSGLAPGKYKAVTLAGADRERANDLTFVQERMRSAEVIGVDFGQAVRLELVAK